MKHARTVKSTAKPAMPADLAPAQGVPSAGLEDMIRERAYCLYLVRGCEQGGALDDWLQAEAQLVQMAQR